MGWFFGKSKNQSNAPQQAGVEDIQFDFGDRFLSLPKRGYFGPYSRSPNGRYILTWRDGNDEGTHGGARTEGPGRYILLDRERIICASRLDRPNDGKVADDGTFILNDWHFFTGDLRGTFCAFRVSGEPIIRQRFEANLYNNGLSSDGAFACCQTCNSDDDYDSSVLAVFDLREGCELSRWMPESGWANGYSFSSDSVALTYSHGPALEYSLTGKFIGRQKWFENGLANGEFRIIETMLREMPKPISEDVAKQLAASCDVSLKAPSYRVSEWQVIGFRLKGECFDGAEMVADALECYEKALTLNPKIGVKRRAEQLRKQLDRG